MNKVGSDHKRQGHGAGSCQDAVRLGLREVGKKLVQVW